MIIEMIAFFLFGIALILILGFCLLPIFIIVDDNYPLENLKNIFKNYKCEHKYHLYDEYIRDGGDFESRMCYDFICEKCKKEYTLYGKNIQKILNKFKEEDKKDKAINIDRNIGDAKITMINDNGLGYFTEMIEYKGKYVTQVIDYYKNKGIDLNQINSFKKIE
jgi:hypothetical protein